MSASWPGSMREPRVKIPLLLLLLLLTTLIGTVFSQDAETQEDGPELDAGGDGETETTAPDPSPPAEDPTSQPVDGNTDEPGSAEDTKQDPSDTNGDVPPTSTQYLDFTGSTTEPVVDQELNLLIILIPVVLVVLIIGMIVCGIFINRQWNKKVINQELQKEDPYLDGSSTEKVPMPMFEEDVPSVLELEMEELGQWMKKDSETPDDSKHE